MKYKIKDILSRGNHPHNLREVVDIKDNYYILKVLSETKKEREFAVMDDKSLMVNGFAITSVEDGELVEEKQEKMPL